MHSHHLLTLLLFCSIPGSTICPPERNHSQEAQTPLERVLQERERIRKEKEKSELEAQKMSERRAQEERERLVAQAARMQAEEKQKEEFKKETETVVNYFEKILKSFPPEKMPDHLFKEFLELVKKDSTLMKVLTDEKTQETKDLREHFYKILSINQRLEFIAEIIEPMTPAETRIIVLEIFDTIQSKDLAEIVKNINLQKLCNLTLLSIPKSENEKEKKAITTKSINLLKELIQENNIDVKFTYDFFIRLLPNITLSVIDEKERKTILDTIDIASSGNVAKKTYLLVMLSDQTQFEAQSSQEKHKEKLNELMIDIMTIFLQNPKLIENLSKDEAQRIKMITVKELRHAKKLQNILETNLPVLLDSDFLINLENLRGRIHEIMFL